MYKTVTGTLEPAGSDTTLLQLTSAKMPMNNMIIVHNIGIEMLNDNWFESCSAVVGTNFTNFQLICKASTLKIVAFFTAKPATTGWTGIYRLNCTKRSATHTFIW